MSVLKNIASSRPILSENELKVADYIIENYNLILNDTVHVMAKNIGVSASTISRFAKKNNFNGFSELRIELAKHENKRQPFDYTDYIKEEDNIETFINKTKEVSENIVSSTYQLLRNDDINDVIEVLYKAKTIYLVGVGASALVCDDFYQKLLRINKNVIFHQDHHVRVVSFSNASKDDVILGVSYSGNTSEVVSSLKTLKKKGITTVSITKIGKNRIERYSDKIIRVPIVEEQEMRYGAMTSRMSTFIVTDILYLGILRKDLEQNKKHLAESRKVLIEATC